MHRTPLWSLIVVWVVGAGLLDELPPAEGALRTGEVDFFAEAAGGGGGGPGIDMLRLALEGDMIILSFQLYMISSVMVLKMVVRKVTGFYIPEDKGPFILASPPGAFMELKLLIVQALRTSQ